MINTWNPAEISDKLNQLEGKIQANDVIANPTGEATETLTKIKIDGDIYSFTATVEADDVPYDNTISGLTADDVQDAIDEVSAAVNLASHAQLAKEDHASEDTYAKLVQRLRANNFESLSAANKRGGIILITSFDGFTNIIFHCNRFVSDTGATYISSTLGDSSATIYSITFGSGTNVSIRKAVIDSTGISISSLNDAESSGNIIFYS